MDCQGYLNVNRSDVDDNERNMKPRVSSAIYPLLII